MKVLYFLYFMLKFVSLKTLFNAEFDKINCPNYCTCDYIEKSADCSNNNISDIPRDIFRDVIFLDLSFNRFSRIPKWIINLSKLEHLDLSNNPKLKLTEMNFESVSMKNLQVKSCSIDNIDNSVFDSFPNLEIFDLSNNPITFLNNSLISLSLKHIILHKTHLKHIKPNTFSGLKSLLHLSLRGNYNLRQFHCSLDNLMVLDVSNCNLEHVPSGLLKKVIELDLQGNNIQLLKNNSLSNFSDVESLNISFNAMKLIEQKCFTHLENLKILDLSFNRLTKIGSRTFQNNSKLKSLFMSHNYVKNIEQLSSKTIELLDLNSCEINNLPKNALTNVPMLKELHLSRNQIFHIPDYFEGTHLVYLDISHNEIASLNNKTFASLRFLRFLVLSGNKLTTIEPRFFPQIIDLSIDDNPWLCDCQELRQIYIWMIRTDQNIRNLRCQLPAKLEGLTWEEACYNSWNKIVPVQKSVWWYSLTFMVIVLLFIILIYLSKKIEQRKKIEEEEEEAEHQRRESERLEFIRREQIREQIRQREEQEESRNAPDPRETQGPPSYNEALLLPRLDASHPSLAGSISSFSNSNPDVSKKRRPQRRKRRRRRSVPSESTSTRSIDVVVDGSDNDRHLNGIEFEESSF